MNALFLKDLADKTRRGLRGRVEKGRFGRRLCYGYRVDAESMSGQITTGEREIEPKEAASSMSIFRDFERGVSPQAKSRSD